MTSFIKKLAAGFQEGKRLSVGIDPHDQLLQGWGLQITAAGAEKFGREIVAHSADAALCVKPQIAFFERFGSAGYRALEAIFADAREAGIPIIADVKRGDIGSTFDAYANAWLQPGSPLEADAMTVHAYQGFGTLSGALNIAATHEKGMFVLSATSNPEAAEVQKARTAGGETLAQSMIRNAQEWNSANQAEKTVGSVGVVLGATLNLSDFGIDIQDQKRGPITPILAPGFGHQGASLDEAAAKFGALSAGLIVHESRSILKGGPQELAKRIADHAQKIGSLT